MKNSFQEKEGTWLLSTGRCLTLFNGEMQTIPRHLSEGQKYKHRTAHSAEATEQQQCLYISSKHVNSTRPGGFEGERVQ